MELYTMSKVPLWIDGGVDVGLEVLVVVTVDEATFVKACTKFCADPHTRDPVILKSLEAIRRVTSNTLTFVTDVVFARSFAANRFYLGLTGKRRFINAHQGVIELAISRMFQAAPPARHTRSWVRVWGSAAELPEKDSSKIKSFIDGV